MEANIWNYRLKEINGDIIQTGINGTFYARRNN